MLAIAIAQDAVPAKTQAAGDDAELLLRDFPKGWLHFSSEQGTLLTTTWQISQEQDANKEPVLVCLGKPDGYVRTEKEYQNFELELEWKYPVDPNGNSGILLFTIEKDMIWPKSIQVQLHRPTAGSVFASNGAKVDNPLSAKDLSQPVNDWNHCRIVCVDGRVTVSVNGTKVGEVTGCMPQKGCVGLQSEGSEIHFRNLKIKSLTNSDKRLSSASRKNSIRHKQIPVCPPELIFTDISESDLVHLNVVTPHRARIEAQRASRQLRRFEMHGKVRPGLLRHLSPFAALGNSPEVESRSTPPP